MSLSAAEIQKSLEASMMSMQIQMENDRKKLTEKIANLELLNKKKDEEIKELKESTLSKKSEDELSNKLIAELNTQIRKKEKENNEHIEQHQKDSLEITNLNNQLSLQNQNLMQLEMDKKNLQSQFFLLQKKLDNFEEEKTNIDKNYAERD